MMNFEFSNPELEESFIPLAKFIFEYENSCNENMYIKIEGGSRYYIYNGKISSFDKITEDDKYYLERISKILLWCIGGNSITIYSDSPKTEALKQFLISEYLPEGGNRSFDSKLMKTIYGSLITIQAYPLEIVPPHKFYYPIKKVETSHNLDNLNRVGLDIGGSSIKMALVKNGELYKFDRIKWFPEANSDCKYHQDSIKNALLSAKNELGTIDAIGVSSAGIHINNETLIASLFRNVPDEDFSKIRTLFKDAAKLVCENECTVVNDGDATAYAGADIIGNFNVLGIAMGTSEAGGFIDKNGNVTGFLNELAFVPVNVAKNAPKDSWSGDIGCGVSYFSIESVLRFASIAGISTNTQMSNAERVLKIQYLAESGDIKAIKVFESIGTIFAHAIALYKRIYNMNEIILLGGVASGIAGEIIKNKALEVLETDYPGYDTNIYLPDPEKCKGRQAIAAAMLA